MTVCVTAIASVLDAQGYIMGAKHDYDQVAEDEHDTEPPQQHIFISS
jgi:hypothetical protein